MILNFLSINVKTPHMFSCWVNLWLKYVDLIIIVCWEKKIDFDITFIYYLSWSWIFYYTYKNSYAAIVLLCSLLRVIGFTLKTAFSLKTFLAQEFCLSSFDNPSIRSVLQNAKVDKFCKKSRIFWWAPKVHHVCFGFIVGDS